MTTALAPSLELAGPSGCPTCGKAWTSRRSVVHANAAKELDWRGMLVGYRRGVMTAALTLVCEGGHAFTLHLAEVWDRGWRLLAVQEGPQE